MGKYCEDHERRGDQGWDVHTVLQFQYGSVWLRLLLAGVNTLAYGATMERKKERLNAESWLYAGFRALAEKGPNGLKAEAIARDLKTTKGSFYWHFKDIPDFKMQMMALWEERAHEGVTKIINEVDGAEARLHLLIKIASANDTKHGGAAAEPAIRDWMRYDDMVRQTVERVDQGRIRYLSGILADAGVSDPLAARVFYAALIGLEVLSISDGVTPNAGLHQVLSYILDTASR